MRPVPGAQEIVPNRTPPPSEETERPRRGRFWALQALGGALVIGGVAMAAMSVQGSGEHEEQMQSLLAQAQSYDSETKAAKREIAAMPTKEAMEANLASAEKAAALVSAKQTEMTALTGPASLEEVPETETGENGGTVPIPAERRAEMAVEAAEKALSQKGREMSALYAPSAEDDGLSSTQAWYSYPDRSVSEDLSWKVWSVSPGLEDEGIHVVWSLGGPDGELRGAAGGILDASTGLIRSVSVAVFPQGGDK